MGAKFDTWTAQLPALTREFVGVNELMQLPNPPAQAMQQWEPLRKKRDDALAEVTAEYQAAPPNAPPSSYPWLGRFIPQASSALSSYPEGRPYLDPVISSFRDLIRFKVLNTTQWAQREWQDLLNKIESL